MVVMIRIIGGNALDDSKVLEGGTEKYVDTPYSKPPDALIWRKKKKRKKLIGYFCTTHHHVFKSQLTGKYLVFVGRGMYTFHNDHRLLVLKGGNSAW